MTHTSKGDVTFVVRLISFRDIAGKNIEIASISLGRFSALLGWFDLIKQNRITFVHLGKIAGKVLF